jgi:transcription elongation factor SPT5
VNNLYNMSDKEDYENLKDDDDEEDEEENEKYDEEEEEDDRPRKKIKTGINQYLDLEAEVNDDDEEEDNEEGEEDFEAFIDKNEQEQIYKPLKATDKSNKFTTLENKQIRSEKYLDDLKQKYRQKEIEGEEEEDEKDEEKEDIDVSKHSLYPTIQDPKLFLVKCKLGKEKESVIAIMNKCLDYESKNKPLQIKSVISIEALKCFIYIEAYKEAHVKAAINGLRNVMEGGIKYVPIKEMVDVLKPTKQFDLKKGSWIRVKRGVFKGDIAQVYEVDVVKSIATIKIVPRFEESKKDKQKESGEKREKKQNIKKLFNSADFPKDSVETKIEQDEKFEYHQGKKYNNGFLLKAVKFQAIDSKNIQPTLEELELFTQSSNEITRFKKNNFFKKGDIIKVIEGDLIGMMGTVYYINNDDNDTVQIIPKDERFKELLELPSSSLQKYFEIGTLIKVVSGNFEGMSGYIVATNEDTVIIYSDLLVKEMEVFIKDIVKITENSNSEVQYGSYALHEIFRIDPQTAGVIIKIEKDVFVLLDNNSNLKSYTLQELNQLHKLNNRVKHFRINDKNNNSIGSGDTIVCIDGPLKGRKGIVKHVYKLYLFCHARDMIENNGKLNW